MVDPGPTAREVQPDANRPQRLERQSEPPREPLDQATPALNRLPRMPFELFLLLAVGLLLLGAFAVVTRLSLSDARSDVADAEDDLAAASVAADDLATTNGELTTTNQTLTDRIGELEADVASAESAAEAAEDAAITMPPVVRPDTSVLEAEIERLEDENADLLADLKSAEAPASAIGDAPVASAESFESVEFTRWIGEVLASEDGVRITGLQSICLADYVIEDIGFDAIGAGLNTSRSTATNDVVIESMVGALSECGIAADNVFGS